MKCFRVPFLKPNGGMDRTGMRNHRSEKIDTQGPRSARGRGRRDITRSGRNVEEPSPVAQVHCIQ